MTAVLKFGGSSLLNAQALTLLLESKTHWSQT